MSDDDDDADYEIWSEMSEEEQEAEFQSLMREYSAALNALPRDKLYAYLRSARLRRCLRWRKLRKQIDIPVMTEHLRKTQLSLLELRIKHYTGLTVGRA